MSLITSPELYINMKSTPQKGDRDYDAFVLSELDKLKYGLTINGVYISNWLYWHINYWQTYIPTVDPRSGDVVDKFMSPELRDNEWLVADYLEQARTTRKGVLIVGARRLAKTTIEASWIGLNATIFQGSQNVIVGNNKSDIRNITLQTDKGLNNVVPFLHYNRTLDDWSKEVELGWKIKAEGNSWRKDPWSNIYIRNTEEGTNTEVLAGLTPKSLIYDEIAKAPTKEAFLAGIKTFAHASGWRTVPILTCTGGSFTKGKDAEEMFYNPERFNLLSVEVAGETRKTAVFIPGNYAVDFPKKEMTLSEYLNIDTPSELDIIKIKVTQWDLSNTMIDAELEKWKTARDQKEYLKALMYAPRNVDDCFLSDQDENPFPVDAMKKHLDILLRTETPQYVRLDRDTDNSVVYTEDKRLKPVSDYPVLKDTIKEAPVVIYEEPMRNAPNFLYIASADPYNQSQSVTSPSLGSMYIYKRTYDPVEGTFQRCIVASYTARPEEMKTWHQTAEMLMELYNATCMTENIGTNFIQYMENKNKGHWLADGFNLAKELNWRTLATVGKMKGLPATTSVQNHYKNLIIEYLNEPLVIGKDPNTSEPITVLGLTRIKDPMLLVELINFRETEFKKGGGMKKKGNFDRYVAFGHALAYEEHLEKTVPNVKVRPEEGKPEKKKDKVRSPFIVTKTQSSLAGTATNPFGI